MENQTTSRQKDSVPTHEDKPIQVSESEREVHIIITDIQLHATQMRKPTSFARGIEKAMHTGKPGRTYANDSIKPVGDNGLSLTLPNADGILEVIEKAKREGKRVRFFMPRAGIPIFYGKDAVEKIASLKRKGEL